MFCTSSKAVAVFGESEIDGGGGKEVSPVGEMKSSASHDRIQQMTMGSRVKNFITGSPLRRRKALSLSTDSGLNSAGCRVFGVPLVDLVTTQGDDIPQIVRRVVEHVDQTGLDEEGVYRINGSAKTIEKLKATFNTMGDADFDYIDIASVAGLLKLFFRELPGALIPPDIESQLVDLQLKFPGEASPEVLPLLRDCLVQLPTVNYAVLKYLVRHLTRVAKHSAENKMTPVSLSIVFGPGIFHCGGGLEGMRQQGYANSVLCRFILNSTALFGSPDTEVASKVKVRPAKPEPYSEHVKRSREGSTSSSTASPEKDRHFSERSVDEAIEQSTENLTPSSSPLNLQVSPPTSPLSSSPSPLTMSDDVFLRRQHVKKGKRNVKIRSRSADYSESPTKVNIASETPSTSPHSKREEESVPGLSPFSSHTSSNFSPSASPSTSPSLTPRSAKVISAVIEGSVKQYLFGPSLPRRPLPQEMDSTATSSSKVHTDVYGLLLPNQCESPAAKRKKPHPPKSHDSHKTTDDITAIPSDPGSTPGEATGVQLRHHHHRDHLSSETVGVTRREGGRRREERKQYCRTVMVESEEGEGGLDSTTVQVFSVSSKSKSEGSEVTIMESGRVSDLVHQFDETDGQQDRVMKTGGMMGIEPPSPPREAPRRKKPRSKEFSMFEKTGMIMGMPMPQPGVGVPSLTSHSPFTTQPPFKGEAESSASGPTDSSRSEQRKAEGWKKMAKPVLPTPIPPLSPTTTSPLSPTATQLLHLPTRDQEMSPTSEESAETSVQQRRGRGRVASDSADQERGGEAGGGRKREADAGLVSEAVHTLRHLTKSRPKGPANRRLPTPQSSYSRLAEDEPTTAVQREEGEGQRRGVEQHHQKDERKQERERERKKVGEEEARETLPTETTDSGRDKKSPRKERKRKAPVDSPGARTHHKHRTAHQTSEVAPEDSTKAVQAWQEEDTDTNRAEETGHVSKLVSNNSRSHDPKHRAWGGKSTSKQKTTQSDLGAPAKRYPPNKDTIVAETVQTLVTEGAGKYTEEGLVAATTEVSETEVTRGLETTLQRLMANLAKKRATAGRPDDLEEMTSAQLSDEKHTVQRVLLHFEKIHGRPCTASDKETMRPLYDRYREVKKLLSAVHHKSEPSKPKVESTVVGSGEETLPSVTLLSSGLALSLPLESRVSSSISQLSHSALELQSSHSTSTTSTSDRVTVRRRRRREAGREGEGPQGMDDRSKTLSELYKQQEVALAEKKRLRRILREFESQFMSTHSRAATKEDRQPCQKEYQEYKGIKEQLSQLANEINRNTHLQNTL